MSLFATLLELEKGSHFYALCTVVAYKGSTPRKPGAKMIVLDDATTHGRIIGTLGGGAIEHFIRQQALVQISLQEPLMITTSLRNELGMCCGGEMSIFIEPIKRRPRLICFGAGHITQNLARLALLLDYQVVVVDARKELLASDIFLDCERIMHSSTLAVPHHYFIDAFCVVATHDHGLDQAIVEGIIDKPFLYAALVGSKRKALMTKKRMQAKGFADTLINRLRVPAGLMIHAQTPMEIAVSIASEMTLVKYELSQNCQHDSGGRHEQPHEFSESFS